MFFRSHIRRFFGLNRLPYIIFLHFKEKRISDLRERLKNGGTVVIAEGYVWELERRGFVKIGSQIPEVVLEKPEEVELLHEEFCLAGSDVVEAFTVSTMLSIIKFVDGSLSCN